MVWTFFLSFLGWLGYQVAQVTQVTGLPITAPHAFIYPPFTVSWSNLLPLHSIHGGGDGARTTETEGPCGLIRFYKHVGTGGRWMKR